MSVPVIFELWTPPLVSFRWGSVFLKTILTTQRSLSSAQRSCGPATACVTPLVRNHRVRQRKETGAKRDQPGAKGMRNGGQCGPISSHASQRDPNGVHFLHLAYPAVAGPQLCCTEHQKLGKGYQKGSNIEPKAVQKLMKKQSKEHERPTNVISSLPEA